MEEKDIINETKKNNKTLILLRFIGIAAMILGIGLKLYDFYANKEIRHCFKAEQSITELTAEEQNMILSAFNVVIPENETDAYISAFCRREEHLYFIEFDLVNDNQNFFDANKDRTGGIGKQGLSVNEILNEKSGYYLTYAEYVFPSAPSEIHRIADLYSELLESRK